MSEYWFGASLSRQFYPLQDGEPYPLPSQAPAIFLFSAMPSAEAALSGAGAFRTHSTWTQQTASPYRASFTLDPIPPPANPEVKSLGFWESVRFVAAAGGAQQSVLRYFELSRPEGTDSDPATTRDDVKAAYPGISTYLTDAQLDSFLSAARVELLLELEARGLQWTTLHKLNKARLVLAYKTISLAAFSQVQAQGDRHWVRWQEFTGKYKTLLDQLRLPQDTDGDGDPDQEARANYGSAVILK